MPSEFSEPASGRVVCLKYIQHRHNRHVGSDPSQLRPGELNVGQRIFFDSEWADARSLFGVSEFEGSDFTAVTLLPVGVKRVKS